MLEPWEHVSLWAPLSPLELPHRDLWEMHRFGLGHGRWERDGCLWLVGLALDGCALKILGQLLERLNLLVPNMGRGGRWCQVLESIDELGGGKCGIFCQGSERYCGIMWKEFYRINVENCPCLSQVYVVASVVVFSSIHIPVISSSGFPTLSGNRLDVYNDFGDWWGNKSGVTVKLAMKLCLG